MASTISFQQHLRAESARWLALLGRLLVRMGLTANDVTCLGFLLSAIACLYIANREHPLAALILGFAGLCDAIDGLIARLTNTVSRAGAFLDSVLDRVSDALPLLTITLVATWLHEESLLILGSGALLVSLLISYIQARAEGLGVKPTTGLMSRVPRFVLLVLGLLTGPLGLRVCLAIICLGGLLTVYQRMRSTFSKLQPSQ